MTVRPLLFAAFGAMIISCSGGSKTPPAVPAGPSSVASILWTFAPADAVAGVVLNDGSLTTLRSWALEAIRIADARPMSAEVVREIRRELSTLPADVFDDKSLEGVGVDISKGVAMFVNAQNQVSLVLPVTNREAFVAVAGGATTNATGVAVDNFDKLQCKMFEARYVCAQSIERLGMVGASPTNTLAQTAAAHTENAADALLLVSPEYNLAAKIPGFEQYIQNPGTLVASAKMSQGKLVARAHLPGTPIGRAQKLVAAPNALSSGVASERPSGFARIRIDPNDLPKPEIEMGPVNVANLLRTVTGELIGMSHAGAPGSISLRVGLNSPDALRGLSQMGCGMVGNFVPFIKLSMDGTACRGTMNMSGIPDAQVRRVIRASKLDLEFDVQDDRADLRIAAGAKGPITNSPSPSAFGADLLAGEWNFALWGEGLSTIYLGELFNFSAMPSKDAEEIRTALWLLGHLYEAGVGIGFRGDGIHGALEVTSFAAATEADYKAYEAALTKASNNDFDGAMADMNAIAKSSPNGLPARQVGFKSAAWLGSMVAGGMAFLGLNARDSGDFEGPIQAPPPPVVSP